MRHLLTAILPIFLVSACATTKEAQVRSALMDAGLNEPMASCMAEPMGKELSVGQLRSIQRVSKLVNTAPSKLTQRQVMDLLKRDLDPETVGVVVRAGFGCFVRGGPVRAGCNGGSTSSGAQAPPAAFLPADAPGWRTPPYRFPQPQEGAGSERRPHQAEPGRMRGRHPPVKARRARRSNERT